MLKTFAAGFLGAVAGLMVAAAVWFAVIQPLDRPGLVWGGSVYNSKQEFNLYLRSKGLIYATWLNRNPGVAPWEPGERAVKSNRSSEVWDWKRDMLLAVNAALLAAIATILLARSRGAWAATGSRAARDEAPRASSVPAATRSVARGIGYVRLGVGELTHGTIDRVLEHPNRRQEVAFVAVAVGLALALGTLVSLALS